MTERTIDELWYETSRLKKRYVEAKKEYEEMLREYDRAVRLEAERSQQKMFQEG